MNPLHEYYIKGTDGVIYQALIQISDNFYLVCDPTATIHINPRPALVIRGEKVEGQRDSFD